MPKATPKSNPSGRPSKFTAEVRARLLDALAKGNHIETACALAGVDYTTYRRWMQAGGAGDEKFREFYEAATRAMADAEASLLTTVKLHSVDDWRAASWILERRHPDRWANTQRVKLEVEKELRKTLDFLESHMTADAYAELLNGLADLDQAGEGEAG